MRSIRWVLLCVVAAGCGEDVALLKDSGEAQSSGSGLTGVRLRVMAANLTSGNGQNYSLGHGARIIAASQPDVVMIQEFKMGGNTASDLRALVDQVCGTTCSYARGSRGNIPNGVISRYPIVGSGDWNDRLVADRAFTWARIDIPGEKDLWAISVHLLTSNASDRQSEARALVQYIQSAVPTGDYVVIGGDFNTKSRTEAALSALNAVVTTGAPWPADRNGNTNTSSNRSRPYDWVVASPALTALQIPTVIGGSTFSSGFVADTRAYNPIEEFAPAQRNDSGAPSMQHMGVVRDFQLSAKQEPPRVTLKLTSPNGGERLTAGQSALVTWVAEGLELLDVDFAADGSAFERIASGVNAASGGLAWTVPAHATTTGVVRISSSVGAELVDLSDSPFTVEIPHVVPPAEIILNEVLANEPGSSSAGEFIELYNAGGSPADLSGWTLSDAVAVRHQFAPGTLLAAGATLVVFGGQSGIPVGVTALAASTGQLGLSNAGDSVTLRNGTSVVDALTYMSSLASVDGVSMNRSPDKMAGAPWALHTTLSSATSSPGRAAVDEP